MAEKVAEKVLKDFGFVLFLIGLFSFVLFILYIISGFLFIFGDSPYPGDIAFIPKNFFLFSFFILLGKFNFVEEVIVYFFDKMGEL